MTDPETLRERVLQAGWLPPNHRIFSEGFTVSSGIMPSRKLDSQKKTGIIKAKIAELDVPEKLSGDKDE